MSWDDISDEWDAPTPTAIPAARRDSGPSPFMWPDEVPRFPRLPAAAVDVVDALDNDEHTVHRASTPRAPTLELRNGTRVALGNSVVLVGRRPAVEDGVTSVVVASDSVSRTHFAIGVKDDNVWVQDRNSTNGTRIVNANGQSVDLTPGRRTLVPLPIRIEFGEEHAEIKA